MRIYITNHSSINPLTDSMENSLPLAPVQQEGTRLYCKEPDYKNFIPDPGTRRRMSRAVRMGVASALQCMENAPAQPDAIITSTGLGCLGDTEKFLKIITENGEQLLNPTPFIQSTFNTVGAQVAMILKNMQYNMTYVHRGFSFENAWLDAVMQLQEKEAGNVLVGSYEETTDTSYEIQSRLGFWRNGAISGEGSHFFMLSTQTESACVFCDMSLVYHPEKGEVQERLQSFLQKNGLTIGDIDVLISGANGAAGDSLVDRGIEEIFHQSTIVRYKQFSGEYQTVTAFACWLAAAFVKTGEIPVYLVHKERQRPVKRILISNHFKGKNHSFLLFENAK